MEALEDGQPLDVAARRIGSRGRLIRRFMSREPAFAEEIGDALAIGQQVYQDRLRATARARATDLENGSDRLLEVELGTHVPGYEHLRRDRVKVEGKVSHEHSLVLPVEVIGKLPKATLEKLDEVLAAIEAVEGETFREIGPGE